MIMWRMKLRNARGLVGTVLLGLAKEPIKTLKFFVQLPLIFLHSWVERRSEEPLSPEMQEYVDEQWRSDYREFQRQIDQLPKHLQDFSRYFGKPKYSSKEVGEILSSDMAKTIIALCPHMERLIPYDIFPAHFWHLIRGIPMHLDRMTDAGAIHADSRITIGRDVKCVEVSHPGPEMNADRLSECFAWELGRDGFDIPNANGMWMWLFDLLLLRPYVFEGFEAQRDGEYLVLVRSAQIPESNPLADNPEELLRKNKLRWETPRT